MMQTGYELINKLFKNPTSIISVKYSIISGWLSASPNSPTSRLVHKIMLVITYNLNIYIYNTVIETIMK